MEKKEWILVVLYILILALITKPFSYGDNESSRFNTIRAIVENHELSWNNLKEPYDTGDKIVVNKKIYSDKPPLFAIICAPIYFILYKFGILLLESPLIVTLTLKIVAGGIMTSLLLLLFYRETKMIIEEKKAFLLTLILGFGTLVCTYATTLNNHTMTALFLFAAFALSLKYWRTKTTSISHFLLLGICLGIVAGLDFITGVFFFFVLAFPIFFINLNNEVQEVEEEKRKKSLLKWKLFFVLIIGWLLPMSIHMYCNYKIIGNPLLPAYAFPQYFTYDGSWQNSSNLPGFYNHQTLRDLLVYSFQMTLGARGLFSYAPVLLFGLFFLTQRVFQKKEIQTLAVLGGILFVISYYCLYTSNYGGSSYGERYLLALSPLLLYYAAPIFSQKSFIPKSSTSESSWIKRSMWLYLFYVAALFSVIASILGALNPWINHYSGWYSISFFVNASLGKTLFYNTFGHYILHFGFGIW